MICPHGVNIEIAACYYCDLYDFEVRPSEPEPTIDDLCESGGHVIHGTMETPQGLIERCYCGEVRKPIPARRAQEERR